MAEKGKTKGQRLTATALEKQSVRLMRLANDRTLIPGIHNYCDRWCERCPQTAHCLVFKTEQVRTRARGGQAARNDLVNRGFWDDLANSLALALSMVRQDAKKRGIDLDSPEVVASAKAEERRRNRRAAREGNGLHLAATAYWKTAKALLDRMPDELRATEDTLNTQARLGTGDPQGTAAEMRDALEVVQWYLFFIDVKLQRAVASRVDRAMEGDDGFPNDADGSAKVALVAIDRSIGAWTRLRSQLDGSADAILDLLVRLERLRRSVEKEFPDARAFRRPGFDPTGPCPSSKVEPCGSAEKH